MTVVKVDGILEFVERLAESAGRFDPSIVTEKNVKPGLRNEDGTGVVVGITSKGNVVGYEKVRVSEGATSDFLENNIHIPDLPEGTHITPALAVYYIVNGRIPDAQILKVFETKLRDLVEYEVRPVEGKLLYCGYSIRELVVPALSNAKSNVFDEVSFLLLTGKLPTQENLDEFRQALNERRIIGKGNSKPFLTDIINMDITTNGEQMGALRSSVSRLGEYASNSSPETLRDAAIGGIELIAKLPTIVAHNYRILLAKERKEIEIIPPDPTLGTGANLLYMLTGERPDLETAILMEVILALHAEHGGGNNSTFNVRSITSTRSDPYSAIVGGIGALKGPLHGGANASVMGMMDYIARNVRDWSDLDAIKAYLTKILNGEAGDGSKLVYGVGHAVYTMSDPRAQILRGIAENVVKRSGFADELLLYDNVAAVAPLLIREMKNKIATPNIDFYSGLVYKSLGLDPRIYTPLFAAGRISGWAAHMIEEWVQGKLMRPAYATSLKGEAKYVPLELRTA